MSDDASIHLLKRWKLDSDQQAAADLFDRYAQRLIALVRSRLPALLRQRIDPEDVVHSVYRSFFFRAREGQLDVQHGGEMWRLLVTITIRKLCYQVGWNQADKRAPQREQGRSPEHMDANLPDQEPSPVEALALLEEVEYV